MHLIAHLIHEYALLGAAIDAGTKHDLNIGTVIIVAAAAAIVGRMLGYLIGRDLGYSARAAVPELYGANRR
jgi:membrane protein DedA with SNARE-associated domain